MIKKITNFFTNNPEKILSLSLITLILVSTYIFISNGENIHLRSNQNSILPLNEDKYFENLIGENDYTEKKFIKINGNFDNVNSFVLKFKFKILDDGKIQNLFQTDNYNSGIRLEYNNNTKKLSLVVPEDKSYRILVFKNSLKKNEVHEFKIHAVDSYGFFSKLNSENIFHYYYNGFKINLNNFIIGKGYDEKRFFSGEISEISYRLSNIDTPIILKEIFKKYSTELSFTIIIFLSFYISLFSKIICKPRYRNFRVFLSNSYSNNIKFILPVIFVSLLYFFPVYLKFILIYIALFFIGIGLYVTILPRFYRDDNFCLYISPILGLLAVTIVGGYLITFSKEIKYLIYLVPIYSFLILFIPDKRIRIFSLIKSTASNLNFYASYYVFISFFLIFLLLLPNIIQPNASFYRIGPDLSLYAKMTQFLLDGGILSDAKLRIDEFLGLSVGEMNRYGNASATWPFMYYFRWGLSAFQSFIVLITPASHVFEISFFSLIYSHLALGFITFYWLKKRFDISLLVSILAATAILFNINILNLWFEGFYANSFSLFIFLFITSLLFWNQKHEKEDIFSIIPITILLFVAALLTYPEGVFFIFGPLIFFTAALEILNYRKIKLIKYLALSISFIVAILFILPCDYLHEWAKIIIKQLSEEGGNGFMQPHWALPHEIFGIFNIYSEIGTHNAGAKLPRSIINYIISIIISIIVIYILIYNFMKNYKNIYPILYAPYILVGIVGIFVFLTSRENNYMYMKYYVFILPILIIYFWSSLNYFIDNKKFINKKYKNIIFIGLTSIILINGNLYIAKYSYQSKYTDDGYINLYLNNKKKNFSNAIIYPYLYDNILYSYSPLIKSSWLIPEQFQIKYHEKNLSKNLYLFIENKYKFLLKFFS